MLKKEDLFEGLKIKSKVGATIVIERIVDTGIYTSGWNLPLKNRDRIFRSNEDVRFLLQEGGFKFIDERITLTISQLYEKLPQLKGFDIEGFESKASTEKVIGEPGLGKGDKLFFKDESSSFRTITDVIKDGKKIVGYYMGILNDANPSDLIFELSVEEVKEHLSVNPVKRCYTLKEVASLLNLESEKYLILKKD